MEFADRTPVLEGTDEREEFGEGVVAVHLAGHQSVRDAVDGGDGLRIVAKAIVTAAVAADVLADRGLSDAEFGGDLPLSQSALGEACGQHRPDRRQEPIDDEFARQDQRHTTDVRLQGYKSASDPTAAAR